MSKVNITPFNDGEFEGVHVTYTDDQGNESMVTLDVIKDTGKARVFIYKENSDIPDETINLN